MRSRVLARRFCREAKTTLTTPRRWRVVSPSFRSESRARGLTTTLPADVRSNIGGRPSDEPLSSGAPAQRWLDADPKNVVCIHCKAGKGRSGVMACCLLLRTGDADSAAAAMALYDSKRVLDSRGLTVTSQRKYVRLYRMT